MTKQLTELHSLLAEKLLEKVKDPECKSADLNVARQFLKDNNIGLASKDNSFAMVSNSVFDSNNFLISLKL